MKKQITIIKASLNTLIADFLFFTYILGCLYYLAHNWTGIKFSSIYILFAGVIAALLFYFIGDSVGHRGFRPRAGLLKKWYRTIWGWLIVIALILTFTVGWDIVEVNPYKFFTKFRNAAGITSGIFDPSVVGYRLTENSFRQLQQEDLPPVVFQKLQPLTNRTYNTRKVFLEEVSRKLNEAEYNRFARLIARYSEKKYDMLNQALGALAETIFLALLATVLAIPLAFILSFFAARNLMPRTWLGNAVYITIRTIATIFRSIEAIVWAIIFSVWVGIGPFAGMLALMVHSVAALTKLYSEQIENIDSGPVEAVKATGATTLQTWIFAVIPQIITPYLAFTIYRWDINVRMATIVGFVGGGGIGLLLLQQQQLLRWHNVGLVIWLIAAVVWSMDMISARIRAKLTQI